MSGDRAKCTLTPTLSRSTGRGGRGADHVWLHEQSDEGVGGDIAGVGEDPRGGAGISIGGSRRKRDTVDAGAWRRIGTRGVGGAAVAGGVLSHAPADRRGA